MLILAVLLKISTGGLISSMGARMSRGFFERKSGTSGKRILGKYFEEEFLVCSEKGRERQMAMLGIRPQ
jgi:hypothetical protein